MYETSGLYCLTLQDDSLQLEFENGTSVLADIVIGADGAALKVQPYIATLKPIYSGNTREGAVYDSATTIRNMHKLLNGGKIFTFGDSKVLIVSSKGNGSVVFL